MKLLMKELIEILCQKSFIVENSFVKKFQGSRFKVQGLEFKVENCKFYI